MARPWGHQYMYARDLVGLEETNWSSDYSNDSKTEELILFSRILFLPYLEEIAGSYFSSF